MKNDAIYNTQEFLLATPEKRDWAFTHKDQNVSVVDAARKIQVDLDLDNLKANVQLNTGEILEISIKTDFYSTTPAKEFTYIPAGRWKTVKESCYMVSGSSPISKNAVYFKTHDLMNSEDVKNILGILKDAHHQFSMKTREMILAELSASHPLLAKKALKEFIEFSKVEGTDQKIYDWFVTHNFKMPSNIKPHDFKNYVAEISRTGKVSSTIHINYTNDKWSHTKGVSAEIDFANMKITSYSWSSDD